MEYEHFYDLVDLCDADNSETLTMCELYDCMIASENDWRLINCPEGL
jgi:hypothetical protein